MMGKLVQNAMCLLFWLFIIVMMAGLGVRVGL
jgi:hypothetical protein